MPDMPMDPFVLVAQVRKRNEDGSIEAHLFGDQMSVHVEDGDEFYTLTSVVNIFNPTPEEK